MLDFKNLKGVVYNEKEYINANDVNSNEFI
jgi:hypothetical protein